MKSKTNGFTLAELLIVVAIIAILVAVAIPVFGSVLERARESTDLSNLRTAYAEASQDMLNNQKPVVHTVVLQQKEEGWEPANQGASLGRCQISTILDNPKIDQLVYVWVTLEGELKITQELGEVPQSTE